MLAGIVDQSRLYDSLANEGILVLTGSDFLDKSPWNRSISRTSLNIIDNSYNFTTASSRISPSNSSLDFDFQDSNFSVSMEIKMNNYNDRTAHNRLVNVWASPLSFQSYYLSILNTQDLEFTYRDDTGTVNTIIAPIPDADFFASFKNFKVQRLDNFLKLFYDDIEIVSSNIGSQKLATVLNNKPLFGSQLSSSNYSFFGLMRNIIISRPSLIVPS